MTEEIILAGFGGQGILLTGRIICIAAMREGKAVSHLPSYGAEMRGGTANCSVVVTDGEVASPVVPRPATCIIMNTPSLLRFEPAIKPGGTLIYNSSLIETRSEREDISCYNVDANDIADEEGSLRAANMVMLGALLKLKPALVGYESAVAALNEAVSSRNKALIEVNLNALKRGWDLF